MSDLISRSELLKAFKKNRIFETVTNAEGKNVLQIIEDTPTAYDVEKVEEENEALKIRCCALSRGTKCLYCQLECKYRTEEYRGDGRE